MKIAGYNHWSLIRDSVPEEDAVPSSYRGSFALLLETFQRLPQNKQAEIKCSIISAPKMSRSITMKGLPLHIHLVPFVHTSF